LSASFWYIALNSTRPAAKIRVSDEAKGGDKARLQESEPYRGDLRDERLSRRVLVRSGI
jgi:hypothetical protein